MMYGGDGWGWGGMGSGGWILMTALAVLFFAVVLAIRYLSGSPTAASAQGSGPAPAEDLLAGRFARGEIDEDEFQRRMTLLRDHR
jgi:putative membrane protein